MRKKKGKKERTQSLLPSYEGKKKKDQEGRGASLFPNSTGEEKGKHLLKERGGKE